MKKRLIIAVVAIALITGSNTGLSQEVGYIELFQRLIDQWNQGTLKLDKKELRPVFEKKITEREAKGLFGYEDKKWVKAALTYWDDRIPERLPSHLKLSTNARLLLMGFFAENLPKYATLMPLQAAEADLKSSLLIVLSKAQNNALSSGRKLIDLEDVLQSMTAKHFARTTEWPVCDPPRSK